MGQMSDPGTGIRQLREELNGGIPDYQMGRFNRNNTHYKDPGVGVVDGEGQQNANTAPEAPSRIVTVPVK